MRLGPLLGDLLGMTNNNGRYINLSDGGHFDNLGVYEMVLRRCRFIVASDASQDPKHEFEDLGNMIRKVRIDFGIEIQFKQPIHILARGDSGHGLLFALATIGYDGIDKEARPGQLLYIKPTLQGRGMTLPYDIFSYSKAVELFPHESTAEQWFSESQFESYRALAEHLVGQICRRGTFENVYGFFSELMETMLSLRPSVQSSLDLRSRWVKSRGSGASRPEKSA